MQSLNNVTDLGILVVTHLSAFYQLTDQLFVESPTRFIEMQLCNCSNCYLKRQSQKITSQSEKRKNEEFNQRYKLRRIKNRTVLYLR